MSKRITETKTEYERLTLNERIQHLVLLISFTTLAITGFMVEIPASWISALRLDYPTLFEIRGLIHRIAAVILILDSLYHLGYLSFTSRGRWQLRELLPRTKDLFDIIQVVKHYRNPDEPMPKFDWFNYKEKAEYWALVWGNMVMSITGAMLWFEQYTPKLFLDIAAVVHTYEALLAVLAIIVWHFYNAHLNPEVFPMSRIWLHGTISEEELLARHPLAYEKVTALVTREVELPKRAKRKWSKIFVLAAVVFIALVFIGFATSVE
ncbi:MAG: formate dehydrogenase subunit gamma, partial [Candidatus Poribacteria bacterium]